MQALYHFTFVKRLIGILGDDCLNPGRNGHASLTFLHDQRLFRYAPAVLVFSPEVIGAFEMERHAGDAAILAGGDEYEFRTPHRIAPLSSYLNGIAVRPSVLAEDGEDFQSQYGMRKREFLSLLREWRACNVQVEIVDFNDTVLDWHHRFVDFDPKVTSIEERNNLPVENPMSYATP